MVIKRSLAAGTAALALSLLITVPVFAHGHHRQTAAQADPQCPVCTVEGCAEEGRHTHDGHEYCGYEHESGYCDGSCETTASCYGYGRHHGCHH